MYSNLAESITSGIGTFQCRKFRKEKLERFDLIDQEYLAREYKKIAKNQSYVEANKYLLETDRFVIHDLNLLGDIDYLKLFAQRLSSECALLIKRFPSDWQRLLILKLEKYALEIPDPEKYSKAGIAARLACPRWWLRRVIVLQARTIENLKRKSGLVCANGQIYCSSFSVMNRRRRRKLTSDLMKKVVARNQLGQEFTLQELADKSVSNPRIKFSELMVRMRGFEDHSEKYDHIGLFITITCPSRFHVFSSRKQGSGKRYYFKNKNYDSSLTVRDCQAYLNDVFAKTRSALRHSDIKPYGFRVVEPHHDGTPHWHLMLFVRPEQKQETIDIFCRYALADSPDERGAKKNRVKIVEIDKGKGSATGYICKYISKAIDGRFTENGSPAADLYGRDAVESSERIQTWASVHGVRQFQQIGGAPVGVWRELRRLGDIDGVEQPGTLADLVGAACSSDWLGYLESMGGVHCSRSDYPVKLVKWVEHDPDTGEILSKLLNSYCEILEGEVLGLEYEGEIFETRFYRWELDFLEPPPAATWSSINNCASSNNHSLVNRKTIKDALKNTKNADSSIYEYLELAYQNA